MAMANTEELNPVLAQVCERLEQNGLYHMHTAVHAHTDEPDAFEEAESIKALIEDGLEVIVHMAFRVGELAWSERILDPEGYAMRHDFDLIAPTEEEVEIAAILSRADEFLDMGIPAGNNEEDSQTEEGE